MAHKGHPLCQWPSIALCERVRHDKMGKCESMTQNKREPTRCRLWAESFIEERGYCDMHAEVLLRGQADFERKLAKQQALVARLDEYIAWTDAHPSVWDQRGLEAGGGG